ncbi:purine nucleoside phosphorylase [Lutzomyia longipalpis]|uniref:Purine nucleoside phosphorylase n=1 Tax=Lutzomyia longipalpis TaxID=7200 RepID=A0A1B0CQA4_LUTLO|nr:purine nucleoside phosphorylase [Lutzomyia longipalpis]
MTNTTNGKVANGNGTSDRHRRSNSPKLEELYPYDLIKQIADHLLERTTFRPKIGIICGSGLGTLAESITNKDIFDYEDIPCFPSTTVEGHAGRMVFGLLNSVPVMCMQGRFHYYEGHSLETCSMPIRVMKLTGVTHLIITNAAGGLNPIYKVGDIVIIKDHLNLMGMAGLNPLLGPNDPRFGPRFPAMNNAYNPEMRVAAKKIAHTMGIGNEIHEGVYTCLAGPNYETPAELRALKTLGVDAVGMSTVHEVVTAKHCNLAVFAISLITNKCIFDYDNPDEACHAEVVEVGKSRQSVLCDLVKGMAAEIVKEEH